MHVSGTLMKRMNYVYVQVCGKIIIASNDLTGKTQYQTRRRAGGGWVGVSIDACTCKVSRCLTPGREITKEVTSAGWYNALR